MQAVVAKFGGSSVATAEGINRVANIILNLAKQQQVFVIVSALRGVTDQLLECVYLAAAQQQGYHKILLNMTIRHHELISQLELGQNDPVRKQIDDLFKELNAALQSIENLHADTPQSLDYITSFGEQLSATILAAFINKTQPARYVDARQFIITDNEFMHAHVLYDSTKDAIQAYFKQFFATGPAIPIITGFFGITKDGKYITTLGRNGSNETAKYIATCLNNLDFQIKEIDVHSDRDGVYSSNPDIIANSVLIDELSYTETKEMSDYARIVHGLISPQLQAQNIPIKIKNTFNPEAKGTLISAHTTSQSVKNIAKVDDYVLITLSPIPKEFSIHNLTGRLCTALTTKKINFHLVAQHADESEVCFAIHTNDKQETLLELHRSFYYELQQQLLSIAEEQEKSVIALVGEGVREDLATLGRIFSKLGQEQITFNGLISDTCKCNFSFLLPSEQALSALKVVHEAVFDNEHQLQHEIKKIAKTEQSSTSNKLQFFAKPEKISEPISQAIQQDKTAKKDTSPLKK